MQFVTYRKQKINMPTVKLFYTCTKPLAIIILTLVTSACAHWGADMSKPYSLKLGGKVGDYDKTQYKNLTITKVSSQGAILQEKQQITDFVIETKVTSKDENRKALSVTSLSKDGPADLHDLAFPDLGQTLQTIVADDGKILFVQDQPPTSVFYVPSISLPSTPVMVGETWDMQSGWVSESMGVPFQLDLLTIFKAIKPCGSKSQCADLELSGEVKIAAAENAGFAFNSEIRGRILFSIDDGMIISSQVNSKERMITQVSDVKVFSCLGSELLETQTGVKSKEPPLCEPPKDE